MYVRLAFAVAAHLRKRNFIFDEVLAVGDAEFQKKCLGKMGDISKGEGRTVLFVSHNMSAVKSLCKRGIVLENGLVKYQGKIDDTLSIYQEHSNQSSRMEFFGNKIIKQAIINATDGSLKYKSKFVLDVYIESDILIKYLVLGIVVKDLNDVEMIGINNSHYQFGKLNKDDVNKGKVTLTINELDLLPGFYKVDLFLGDSTTDVEEVNEALTFEVTEDYDYEIVNGLNLKINRIFHKSVDWKFTNI